MHGGQAAAGSFPVSTAATLRFVVRHSLKEPPRRLVETPAVRSIDSVLYDVATRQLAVEDKLLRITCRSHSLPSLPPLSPQPPLALT
jgi:hypothetical protein